MMKKYNIHTIITAVTTTGLSKNVRNRAASSIGSIKLGITSIPPEKDVKWVHRQCSMSGVERGDT